MDADNRIPAHLLSDPPVPPTLSQSVVNNPPLADLNSDLRTARTVLFHTRDALRGIMEGLFGAVPPPADQKDGAPPEGELTVARFRARHLLEEAEALHELVAQLKGFL